MAYEAQLQYEGGIRRTTLVTQRYKPLREATLRGWRCYDDTAWTVLLCNTGRLYRMAEPARPVVLRGLGCRCRSYMIEMGVIEAPSVGI